MKNYQLYERQPGVLTCQACGLGYYPTATPHVCAPGGPGGQAGVTTRHTNDCVRRRARFGGRSTAGDVCSCGGVPAPGGGVMPVEPKTNGDWYYAETAYGAEVEAGRFTLKAHWSGLAETDNIRATMRQVVADHRLAGLVPGLVAALRKLDELDWVVGYELTEVNMRILQEALDLTGAALAAARKAGVEDE